jgi:hypothetical protein
VGKLKGTGSLEGRTSAWLPAAGVTAANYFEHARDCFRARGKAFIVAVEDGNVQGLEYRYSARQWGAWLAFFKARKIPHFLMLRRNWYDVPTEWPHEFSADATAQDDHEAGAAFEREMLRQIDREKASLARRVDREAGAAAAKARMRGDQRKQPTPSEHIEPLTEIDPPWKTDMSSATHLLETDLLRQ